MTLDQIDKEIIRVQSAIKKEYRELNKLNTEFANEFMIGNAYGHEDINFYAFPFDCPDGKNLRCIIVNKFSQQMIEDTLSIKADVFRHKTSKAGILKEMEEMYNGFIKTIKQTKGE